LYLFSLTPSYGRGNNSGKHGNSAGTIRHSPAGIIEAIFGNVTGAEKVGGGALGGRVGKKGVDDY
jgi:hypothetical protein